MTEKIETPRADDDSVKLDAILKAVAGLIARVDAMEEEKNEPAPPLVSAADKKRKDEEACADEDEDDRSDAEEEEAKSDEDDAKKDAKKDAEEEMKDDSEGKMEGVGEMKFDEDTEEEQEKKADAQAKADSVYASFGKSASRPMQGENVMAYRKRMLKGLQKYSDSYKSVNINSIKDEALLSLAEKQIFADALSASRTSVGVGAGRLVELHERDRAGRTITKFRGDMDSWLGAFKVPPMRVEKFNTNNGK